MKDEQFKYIWNRIIKEVPDEKYKWIFEIDLEPYPNEDKLSERFWNEDIALAKTIIRTYGGYDGCCHPDGYLLWAGFETIRNLRIAKAVLCRKLDRNRISWRIWDKGILHD